ncbi:MAG: NAD-dependent epimerase/dehydratase family protein [Elusimicrobiota bacterium]
MKILVFGGTSFFGLQAAKAAFSAGHDVTVFSRRDPPEGFPLDIKFIKGDRSVEADLSRITLKTWDAVFDNICYTPQDAQKAVKKFSGKCGFYLMTSSEAVYYLIKDLSSPFRENHTEIFKENIEMKKGGFWDYACGKYLSERVFLKAFEEIKFPVSIVRPPIVIGPQDNTLRAYSYWIRIADGYPFFAPGWSFLKRFAYSEDMSSWINAIIENPEKSIGEIFNLGDAETISLGDFLKVSAEIMGKPLLGLPADFTWLKENGFNLSASPYSSKRDYITDIEKAQKVFGFKSTPIRQWLEESIKWFFFKYTGSKPADYALRSEEIKLCDKWIKEKNI